MSTFKLCLLMRYLLNFLLVICRRVAVQERVDQHQEDGNVFSQILVWFSVTWQNHCMSLPNGRGFGFDASHRS